MVIDFDLEKTYMQSIEVQDIGNVCLRCTSKAYEDYYISVKSLAGQAYVLIFGPCLPDVGDEAKLDSFSLSYTHFDYSDKKVKKAIDGIVNNAKIGITIVEEIDQDELFDHIPKKNSFIPE